MSVQLQESAFNEDRVIRERFISKTEVLDKVKILSFLPDGEHVTVRAISEFYEVGIEAIQSIIKNHRNELESDNMKTFKGKELKDFAMSLKNIAKNDSDFAINNKVRHLTVFNRRCILRIGMLLRDSEIAKQVRTYLLNIEEEADQQQKIRATRGSKWDGKDLILYDMIIVGVSEGKTLSKICEEASLKLNESPNSCRNRYTSTIKKRIQNEELIRKIESNKRGFGKKRAVLDEDFDLEALSKDFSDLDCTSGVCKPNWAYSYLDHVVQMNIETNSMITQMYEKFTGEYIKENESLRNENKRLSDEIRNIRHSLQTSIFGGKDA